MKLSKKTKAEPRGHKVSKLGRTNWCIGAVRKSPIPVKPDDSMSVKMIMDRFVKSGNQGNIVEGKPQYSDSAVSHQTPDFNKLRLLDKLEAIDLQRELAAEVKAAKTRAAKAAKAAKGVAKAASGGGDQGVPPVENPAP